jgi:hypothetical protein
VVDDQPRDELLAQLLGYIWEKRQTIKGQQTVPG